MELYHADHAVISGGYFRFLVTPIMEQVVPLNGQLTDRPFRQIVVYRKLPRRPGKRRAPSKISPDN